MNPKQKLKMKISERVEIFISEWRQDLTLRGFSEEYKDLHGQFAKLSAENTRLKMACKNKEEYKQKLALQEEKLNSILGKHPLVLDVENDDSGDLDDCLKNLKNTTISLGICKEKTNRYTNLSNDLVDLYSTDGDINVKYTYTTKDKLMRLLPEGTTGDGNCFWYSIMKSINEGRKGSIFDEISSSNSSMTLRFVLNEWSKKYEVATGSILDEDEYGNIFDVSFLRWITLQTFDNTSIDEKKLFILAHCSTGICIDIDNERQVQKELDKVRKNISTDKQWVYGRISHFLYEALEKLVTFCVFSTEEFSNMNVKNFLVLSSITRGLDFDKFDDIRSLLYIHYTGGNHYETMPRLDNSARSHYITINNGEYIPKP